MNTSAKMSRPVKLLSAMLLSISLVVPVVAEAGRGHHHHHNDHDHHDHYDYHEHYYYNAGPGYRGYGELPRHIQHNHYNTQHIYYNQPYYPPVYGAGYYGIVPNNFFLGINTGNTRFMLGY